MAGSCVHKPPTPHNTADKTHHNASRKHTYLHNVIHIYNNIIHISYSIILYYKLLPTESAWHDIRA